VLDAIGREARQAGKLYLTGGATAVLLGWRTSTMDIDLLLDPEQDSILRALPRTKEALEVNIELAAPFHFIPPVPGWQDRSLSAGAFGPLDVRHFDLYSQALSKLERGHTRDLADVRAMIDLGLVVPARLESCLGEIEPFLYKYPAVDPRSFRKRVEEFLGALGSERGPAE
jgi:hypothetical protein